MFKTDLKHKKEHHGGISHVEELYLQEVQYGLKHISNKQSLFTSNVLTITK